MNEKLTPYLKAIFLNALHLYRSKDKKSGVHLTHPSRTRRNYKKIKAKKWMQKLSRKQNKRK